MPLSQRIREQRKKCGLSQEKVAEIVGVSRQAVTKWETGQSAPTTENLFKLAEAFGTTVDMLLASEPAEKSLPCPAEAPLPAAARRKRWKSSLLCAMAVIAGYLLVYLAGRIFGNGGGETSITGWLFGTDPKGLTYLYGWLLHQKLYWLAMAVSAVPALLGSRYFPFVSLFGFSAGLLIGELCGANPAGAAYGAGHYGGAIWGGIFLLSLVMGIVLERLAKGGITLKTRRLWIWGAVFAAGILLVVLAVRLSIPEAYGG